MTPACMSPDELRLWHEAATLAKATTPCFDCPLWFALEQRAEGCCNGVTEEERVPALPKVDPPMLRPLPKRGRPPEYLTFEQQQNARRKSWRESKRRAAARRRTMKQSAVVLLTSGREPGCGLDTATRPAA